MSQKRVLIFNFFSGAVDRGIPFYAQDIAECMRRVGFEPIELRCPRWFRGAPRVLQNAAFVLFEQLVAPAMRVLAGCSLTVYPYNSAGIVDALLGRGVLVVHDLISNRRATAPARYIQLTQAVHRRLAGRLCAASPHTFHVLARLPAFRRCPLVLWSNPFYSFEAALEAQFPTARAGRAPGPLRVLLCSGLGRNKDYGGALHLFRRSRTLRDATLRIVGFGRDAALAERRLRRLPPTVRARIEVLPRLTLEELVSEYLASDLVWVHSQREGFGRSMMEGRLAGRAVVASAISPFRRLADAGVQLYGGHSFDQAVVRALSNLPAARASAVAHHAALEAVVRTLLEWPAAAPLLSDENNVGGVREMHRSVDEQTAEAGTASQA